MLSGEIARQPENRQMRKSCDGHSEIGQPNLTCYIQKEPLFETVAVDPLDARLL